LSDPALTAVAVSMFSAPATSIVNQLFAAVEKIPCASFSLSLNSVTVTSKSVFIVFCASGTRFGRRFIGDSSVASASSNVFAPQQYFFFVLERLLVDRRCLWSSTSALGILYFFS